MKIRAYRLSDKEECMRIIPGNKRRQWMDDTPHKYAYRCLPLQIANSTGWDVYPPCEFVVNWSGGQDQRDLDINYDSDTAHFASSTFGCGILTMHMGYMFRTEPGWNMMVIPVPNEPLKWGTALSGIVETWWLDFTFTINIKLHEPGYYHIQPDQPLARLMIIPHQLDIETDQVFLYDKEHEGQMETFQEWSLDRQMSISDMKEAYEKGQDHGSVKIDEPSTHWEKNYYVGKHKDGTKIQGHIKKVTYPKFTEKK